MGKGASIFELAGQTHGKIAARLRLEFRVVDCRAAVHWVRRRAKMGLRRVWVARRRRVAVVKGEFGTRAVVKGGVQAERGRCRPSLWLRRGCCRNTGGMFNQYRIRALSNDVRDAGRAGSIC